MQLPFDFRFAWAEAKLVIPFVSRGICAEGTSELAIPIDPAAADRLGSLTDSNLVLPSSAAHRPLSGIIALSDGRCF